MKNDRDYVVPVRHRHLPEMRQAFRACRILLRIMNMTEQGEGLVDHMPEWARRKLEFWNAKAKITMGNMAVIQRFDQRLEREARAAVRKRFPDLPPDLAKAAVAMEKCVMAKTRQAELGIRFRKMWNRKRRD